MCSKAVDKLQYIIELYGDGDPTVAAAVDSYFERGGEEALRDLRAAFQSELLPARKHKLRSMIERYSRKSVLSALKRTAQRCTGGEECDLTESGYLLCALFDPTLSREEYMEAVMPLIIAVISEISESKTGPENISLLNHIFYRRFGYSAAGAFDITLENTLLMNVIRSKKGSPFALALLYFIVAQGAGLPVYPLCFTGGFIPVYEERGKVLFNINVFHEGEIFVENNISDMVSKQASSLGVNVDIGKATVRKDHSILVQYLEFLQVLCTAAADPGRQQTIEDAIEALGSRRFLSVESDEEDW